MFDKSKLVMFMLCFRNMSVAPPVLWAQRPNLVFVTINVSDCVDPEIKVSFKLNVQCWKINLHS